MTWGFLEQDLCKLDAVDCCIMKSIHKSNISYLQTDSHNGRWPVDDASIRPDFRQELMQQSITFVTPDDDRAATVQQLPFNNVVPYLPATTNRAIIDRRLHRILRNSTKHCSCLTSNWYRHLTSSPPPSPLTDNI